MTGKGSEGAPFCTNINGQHIELLLGALVLPLIFLTGFFFVESMVHRSITRVLTLDLLFGVLVLILLLCAPYV